MAIPGDGGDVGAAIASAASYSEAARAIGVDKSTIFRWVKSGEGAPAWRPAAGGARAGARGLASLDVCEITNGATVRACGGGAGPRF